MKRLFPSALLVGAVALGPLLAQQSEPPPAGFSSASAGAIAPFERIVLDTPTPERLRRWLFALTEEPHVAGTPAEKRVADWVGARFEEFGLSVETVAYDVFLNHPRQVSLRLIEPVEEPLSLMEDSIALDKDSTSRGAFPAFHGYGASGTASGQVVYANYGTAADYDRLSQLGITVDGRIALVRYGGTFRGLKVKEAEDRGALGVLIYSDPADDGYMRGDVYPDGPMRPPSAIQRGSVQFLSQQPGDPSTPGGVPSTDGAVRVARPDMTNLPTVPSLPIAYREAEKILRTLGGPNVPDGWQGGLPFAYHVGPGRAAVEMAIEMDEGLKPIYNVIATIPGATDQVVVIGNHRDAWTPGAVDPNSGTAAVLEAARALGEAVEAGWRPKRTILICSWDAEEYGLVGSTEWAEAHRDMLTERAVAYLNVDVAVTGPDFDAGGTPSMRDVMREVARAVPEPRRGGSVGAAWERARREAWATSAPVDLTSSDAAFTLQLRRLGSGSDYTVFLDHLGVPSTDFSFSGGYGVYHSIYDNFFWMSRFGDPEFIYHQAAARVMGLLAMRMASADVVPLRFSNYGGALADDLDAIRSDVVRRARRAQDPPFAPDFAPLLRAIADFDAAGQAADAAVDRILASGDARAADRASAALVQVERAFLDPEGLPGRPWFRHQLIAPGLTTGYAPWPFPGVREAVDKADASMFAAESAKVVAALAAGAERLRQAAALAP